MLVSGDSSVIDVKTTPAKKLLAHKQSDERDNLVLITTTLCCKEDTLNLINEKNLAKKLDISVHKLRKDRIKKRGIQAIKLGRSVRYDLDNVDKYLKDNSFRLTT